MRNLAIIFYAILLLSSCNDPIAKNNAVETPPDVQEEKFAISGEYAVVSESVLFVTVYLDDPNDIDGRVFMELKAGDRIRYTGREVTFPTGLAGYEFEVTSLIYRDPEDDYVSNPEIGERCYLSKDEIIENLVGFEAGE